MPYVTSVERTGIKKGERSIGLNLDHNIGVFTTQF